MGLGVGEACCRQLVVTTPPAIAASPGVRVVPGGPLAHGCSPQQPMKGHREAWGGAEGHRGERSPQEGSGSASHQLSD